MKITDNFKKHLMVAKDKGFETIIVTCASNYGNEAVNTYNINDLLKDEIGKNYGAGWGSWCCKDWNPINNPKAIKYSRVFHL